MAKNYFDRYIWLIDVINRHGHITKKEIDELWYDSSLNEKRDRELPERTFHNHREAILDTFGIEIKCDRSLGYYLANSEDLEGDDIRKWLLESLSLNNLLRESKDMRESILFETIPSSQRWLSPIMNAIKDKRAIDMTYQSFFSEEPHSFTAHPWCLKLFRQRWYMLARSEEYHYPRTYALDRILSLKESKKALEVPKGFNGQEYFGDYFGIFTEKNGKPETVRLKVAADQVKFVESLPLHHSQHAVEVTPEYTVFEYFLVPTFDFGQEILSRGPEVTVLKPEWFREEIREDIAAMLKNYE